MSTQSIQRILVPVDFSPVALNTLETAIAVCTRQLAALTLIHVVENSYVMFPPEAGGASGALQPELVKSSNESLTELARKLRMKHDLVINHVIQTGNPADEICRWADHKNMDLIIMGTNGANGLYEFFIGSNAYRVVKNAPCPVMTIPGNNQWQEFKRILFPVRTLTNVIDKYDALRPIIRKNGSSIQIAGIVDKHDDVDVSEIKDAVELMRKKMQADEFICGTEMHHCDNVARQLHRLSEKYKPDLIVISATTERSFDELFLKAYTQDIVNHSHFPVLSIRSAQVKRAGDGVTDYQHQSMPSSGLAIV